MFAHILKTELHEADWTCDCGAAIDFPSLEEEKGFVASRATCPECGRIWVLRLAKAGKVK